jgi:Tfp pilus assembly protein PilN
MRPVNLLPSSARPYVATGAKSNSSYVVLCVLTALVIAAAAYVLTTNQIAKRNDQIATAKTEQTQAEAKVSALSTYGTFSQVAETRISTVGSLAIGRIDYERLMRETARVLPTGVWLTAFDAEGGSGINAGAVSAAAASTGAVNAGPTVHLLGCAKTQDQVATTLVRLRAIHGSDEVDLASSTKGIAQANVGASDGGSAGCGSGYAFDITVNLAATTVTGLGDAGQKIPVSLGGGS